MHLDSVRVGMLWQQSQEMYERQMTSPRRTCRLGTPRQLGTTCRLGAASIRPRNALGATGALATGALAASALAASALAAGTLAAGTLATGAFAAGALPAGALAPCLSCGPPVAPGPADRAFVVNNDATNGQRAGHHAKKGNQSQSSQHPGLPG